MTIKSLSGLRAALAKIPRSVQRKVILHWMKGRCTYAIELVEGYTP